jgi:hypothetical protein
VLCLVEHEKELFAGTMSTCDTGSVGRVYKYLGGTAWAPVGGTLDNQVSSLVVYNDNLYAGTTITYMTLLPGDQWLMEMLMIRVLHEVILLD